MSPASSVTMMRVSGITSISSMTCSTPSAESVSNAESELDMTAACDCMALFFERSTRSRLAMMG